MHPPIVPLHARLFELTQGMLAPCVRHGCRYVWCAQPRNRALPDVSLQVLSSDALVGVCKLLSNDF
eukprot:10329899-Alexandrium_andersonii.AAC.1